jgi:hypothetical protein
MRRPDQTVETAAVQLRDARSRQVQDLDHGRGRAPPRHPGYRGHGPITMAAMTAMTDQMSIQPATPGRAGTLSVLQRG